MFDQEFANKVYKGVVWLRKRKWQLIHWTDCSNTVYLAKPSVELEQMQSICGERDEEFDAELTRKRQQRRRYRGRSDDDDDEDDDEEEDEMEARKPYRRGYGRYQLKILGGKSAKSLSWPWHVS